MKGISISHSTKRGLPAAGKPSPASPERGFTLLEVMIAMAILAIALVAVYQAQSQGLSMAGDSRFLTTASLLAQGRMAAIDTMEVSEIKDEQGDFGEDFPAYSWRVAIGDTEIPQLKRIVLTVVNSRMKIRNEYHLVLYKAGM